MLGMEYSRAMLHKRGHELQMNEQDLFTKICNADCSLETLEPFIVGSEIIRDKFDLKDSFGAYYNINKILSVIEKYQSGKVDKRYLSYWARAYQSILIESFSSSYEIDFLLDYRNVSLKEFLFSILFDWLDSLTFFDKKEVSEYFNFDKFKTDLKNLDRIIKDDDLGLIDAELARYKKNNYVVAVLIVNDTDKYYEKLYGYLDYYTNKIEFKKTSYSALCNRESQLLKLGYKELSELC